MSVNIYKESTDELINIAGSSGSSTTTIKAVYDESPALYPHAVDSYVYFNDHIYKVTSAISIGDTITVGTNVTIDPNLSADDLIGFDNIPGGGSEPQTAIIALSSTSVSVDDTTSTTTVTMTTNSDGIPTVNSSDASIATATISNNIITITGVNTGSATVTISIPATSAYTAASATIAVSSTVTPPFVPEVGTKYKLGSGAHTGGSAIAEATCLAVDTTNNTALMISNGLYGAAWPGSSELDISTYMGNLNTAIDDAYLPRGNADGSSTTTRPTSVYVYNGSSWTDSYSDNVKTVLMMAAGAYSSLGASGNCAWLGTPYDSSNAWYVYSNGPITYDSTSGSYVIAPTFILDLSKVTLKGSAICLKGDSGVVIGNTYFFGGHYWTAAEDLGDNAVCLQSQGMTAGAWPGYKLASDYSGTKSYGSANSYYTSDIDGDNIANYDDVTSTWYSKYSAVEKTGASYGSGLFLVSNAKCGTTTTDTQGSGNYWNALKAAATAQYAYLGTYGEASYCIWAVHSQGTLISDAVLQYLNQAIAPAFNLDLTKVKLVDDHIMLPTEEMPTLVTWANGTDAQISTMVEAADNGIIDLYADGGWRVGDERTVSLSAITASGTYDGVSWSVGESQSAQTITLVLMARDHYTLTNATSGGRTKCSFVVGVKNCLGTYGYMNSTATNTGSWSSSARRAWCNGGFRQALPSALRGIFKQFKVTTATEYNASTTTDTNDYFALFAEKEIFGSATYSNTTEANALSSITWYETSSNRIKKQGDSGSAYYWWERSPYASGANSFCYVGNTGGADATNAFGADGLSPFGCM